MRQCIYCLTKNENVNGRVHVIPEAIFPNNIVFPNGTMCDNCNNYCSKLENSLVSHPDISRIIQFKKIPGKRGKIRKTLGLWPTEGPLRIHFNDLEGMTITSIEPTINTNNQLGWMTWAPILKGQSDYDYIKFVRSIYYLAFNFLAFSNYESVIQNRYNKVRNYIRKPRREECWEYIMKVHEDAPNYPAFLNAPRLGKLLSDSPGDSYRLEVLGVLFYLDFQHTGELSVWLKKKLGID